MPRIKNISGSYHIYFVSFDCHEPAHIHVVREKMEAKFWLKPLEPTYNYGFSKKELNKIRKLIDEHLKQILEAWYEHCNGR